MSMDGCKPDAVRVNKRRGVDSRHSGVILLINGGVYNHK
jgi:hypothetical protein